MDHFKSVSHTIGASFEPPSEASVTRFKDATSDREAFDYVLSLIHSDELSPERQTQVMHDTLDCW
jgi:hypothetical protein